MQRKLEEMISNCILEIVVNGDAMGLHGSDCRYLSRPDRIIPKYRNLHHYIEYTAELGIKFLNENSQDLIEFLGDSIEYDIIVDKRWFGHELTEEELYFLDNYDDNYYFLYRDFIYEINLQYLDNVDDFYVKEQYIEPFLMEAYNLLKNGSTL